LKTGIQFNPQRAKDAIRNFSLLSAVAQIFPNEGANQSMFPSIWKSYHPGIACVVPQSTVSAAWPVGDPLILLKVHPTTAASRFSLD